MSVRRTAGDAPMMSCIVVAIAVSWFTIQVVDLAIQVLS